MTEDTAHDALILYLEVLLQEAKDFAFHDFKNYKYPAPKMALVDRLNHLATWVKEGKYDN